jgi:hypothetical protein
VQIVSRRATSQAWSEFLLDYHTQDEDKEVGTDELHKFLVQTSSAAAAGPSRADARPKRVHEVSEPG